MGRPTARFRLHTRGESETRNSDSAARARDVVGTFPIKLFFFCWSLLPLVSAFLLFAFARRTVWSLSRGSGSHVTVDVFNHFLVRWKLKEMNLVPKRECKERQVKKCWLSSMTDAEARLGSAPPFSARMQPRKQNATQGRRKARKNGE
jgi:hypothetical protein